MPEADISVKVQAQHLPTRIQLGTANWWQAVKQSCILEVVQVAPSWAADWSAVIGNQVLPSSLTCCSEARYFFLTRRGLCDLFKSLCRYSGAVLPISRLR